MSQSINWIHIANDISSANTLYNLSDGGYLLTNTTLSPGPSYNLMKVSRTGNLVWEKNLNVAGNEAIIYATERPNRDLLFVSREGKIYTTDENGNGGIFIDQLSPSSSTSIDGLRYEVTHQNVIHFIGTATTNTSEQTLRASINTNTLDVKTNFGDEESYPNGIAFSSEGLRAELRSDIRGASIHFYNDNLEETSSITMPSTNQGFFSDLTFDHNGNLFVIGTEGSMDSPNLRLNGFVALVDTSRTLVELKRLPRSNGFESLGLKHILSREGRIFIGGRSGPTLESHKAFVGEINVAGELLWETTFDVIDNFTEFVVILDFVSNSEPNELIVLGTGGLSDSNISQRLFLANVSINTSSTRDGQLPTTPLYYPNPVVDILHIHQPTVDNSIEVLNSAGQRIFTIPAGTQSIDMSNYHPGVYYLSNTDKEKTSYSIKVIKQ